ncbi:hypothetical protein Goshw_024897 [Gossypium schwendimanii]|uniref:NAD-dependent epimerase/dehydratase domain-containing protein n=1 Tax=Gossypium schwendimanii TaxID=34291 RepID=A0A7J9N450_GOSSC|nr:hypothetical protein [Gossypium schwendimanii]
MKQSEVFQSRTVEKKTGMTWDCESRAYGIWYTPEFGFPGRLWNAYPSCQTEDQKGYVGEWEESVTGGIGYIGSWLIEVLLRQGYSVHTTVRPDPGKISDLPRVSMRPWKVAEGFSVLHVSAPMDFQDNEPEAVLTQRSVDGALGIVKSCLRPKTVKRVVHTSSISAMCFNKENVERMDESYWTDVDYVRSELNSYVSSYAISKTETEKAVSEVATEHGLDLVTIIPPIVVGPFICPKMHGNKDYYSLLINVATVHIDDLARAMIFPREKGDFIVPQTHFVAEIEGAKMPGLSSKKLLDFGFKFNYGAEGMYDGAIKCCREKGFL